jgi:CTP:phosphocholine cytidylyltransferase-like protein
MTAEQATTLKTTLESMFEHIAQKQSIVEDLQQIEHLHQEIGAVVPPQLRHYLQRRSYTKALDFLKDSFVVDSD